ncbi:MAG: glycosyltransferase involved in cell wall biosynthesis [Rubritalea sp.]|jgi:glycosyltransferase involved in cell wall biosynthesis
MKVLHICQRDDPAMGGAARVAVELVKRLNAHGIDARCLFLYGGPGGLSTEIREQSSWLGLMSSKDVLLKGGRLLAFLKETQPDIIHHHDGVTWSHLMTRLGYHGIRYGHAHNDGPQKGAPARMRFANWVHRQTYQHLIAVSSVTAEAWTNRGFSENRVELLPNGVDTAKFYPGSKIEQSSARKKLDIPSEAKVLLSVGRLHLGMKGTDDFLRVISELDGDYYGVIAGVGPDEDLLRKLAASLGVADRVRFCGLVDPVLPCYHATDLLMVTSHFEPFGLMVVEAMACGLPIAAFATTGGVMAILQKSGALISPQRDPAHLASLIKTAFESDEDEQKSLANLDLVKNDYSWDAAASALAASYFSRMKGGLSCLSD